MPDQFPQQPNQTHTPNTERAARYCRQILQRNKSNNVELYFPETAYKADKEPTRFSDTEVRSFDVNFRINVGEFGVNESDVSNWLKSISTDEQLSEFVLEKINISKRIKAALARSGSLRPSNRPTAPSLLRNLEAKQSDASLQDLIDLSDLYSIISQVDPSITRENIGFLFDYKTKLSISELNKLRDEGLINLAIRFTYKTLTQKNADNPKTDLDHEIEMYIEFSNNQINTLCAIKPVDGVSFDPRENTFANITVRALGAVPLSENREVLKTSNGIIGKVFAEILKMHLANFVHLDLSLNNILYQNYRGSLRIILMDLTQARRRDRLDYQAVLNADIRNFANNLLAELNIEGQILSRQDLTYLVAHIRTYQQGLVTGYFIDEREVESRIAKERDLDQELTMTFAPLYAKISELLRLKN